MSDKKHSEHEKHHKHGHHLKDAQGRKSVQEIIREQLAANGREDDYKKIYTIVSKVLSTDKFRMLRHGDTLFLLGLRGDGVAHMNMFNADTPKNLIKNFKQAYDAVRVAGFKKITFESDNPKIVEAGKNLGIDIKAGDKPNDYIIMVS